MISIFEEVLKRAEQDERIALVTIVDVSGSFPWKLGSNTAVNKDRLITSSTIGGRND
jgi:xanthine/CO dehydrogenase XdhC/CoxF family maturation factor